MPETVPTRFYDYLTQIYGGAGALDKLDSVKEAQRRRPKELAGLPKMRMDRIFDQTPVTFSEQKPLYYGEPAEGLYSPTTREATIYSPEGRELPLMTREPSEGDLDMGSARMPWQSYVALHEKGHDKHGHQEDP